MEALDSAKQWSRIWSDSRATPLQSNKGLAMITKLTRVAKHVHYSMGGVSYSCFGFQRQEGNPKTTKQQNNRTTKQKSKKQKKDDPSWCKCTGLLPLFRDRHPSVPQFKHGITRFRLVCVRTQWNIGLTGFGIQSHDQGQLDDPNKYWDDLWDQ